jgi:hypothetical protein
MKSKGKILALASGGGHWVQLLRLRPAFADYETVFVSMFESYSDQVGSAAFHVVPDASRFDVKGFGPVFIKALRILLRERPVAIVTTGSAPMLAFILLGRMFNCRTLWIDSIANSERMSSSGRLAKKLAHRCISQWPEVARDEAVDYWGSVL